MAIPRSVLRGAMAQAKASGLITPMAYTTKLYRDHHYGCGHTVSQFDGWSGRAPLAEVERSGAREERIPVPHREPCPDCHARMLTKAIADEVAIFTRPDGSRYARSAKTPANVSYDLTFAHCACPGFSGHGRCKHLAALIELSRRGELSTGGN